MSTYVVIKFFSFSFFYFKVMVDGVDGLDIIPVLVPLAKDTEGDTAIILLHTMEGNHVQDLVFNIQIAEVISKKKLIQVQLFSKSRW